MKFYQKADGGVLASTREYDIAKTTEIKCGQVVVLTEGLVAAAAANGTTRILGVAAEDHSGAADALNPRSNGTKILVIDAPDAIFRCKAPIMTATGGSATTVTANTLAAFSNDDFNGGYLLLVEKGASSTNTDPIGTIKRITDYSYNSTGTVSTFTVASGATAAEGDKFVVFPPIGFAKGNLSSTRDALVLTATAGIPLKVVGRIEETQEICMMANTHLLGVEE
ncbi:MAG: hypothetical protein IJT18_08075 [Oscillospiraceae bacterium]|nr:hypothetical protein [Oscillospiraceae bacterium]